MSSHNEKNSYADAVRRSPSITLPSIHERQEDENIPTTTADISDLQEQHSPRKDLPVLHVDNLHPDISEYELQKIVEACEEIEVDTVTIVRDSYSGRSLGCGEVKICNEEGIQDIIDSLDHHCSVDSRGLPVRVFWKNREHTNCKVVVKNLNPGTTAETLKLIFSYVGTVTAISMNTSRKSKGVVHGHVSFSNQDGAEEAINKIHGLLLNGRQVYVEHVVDSKSRVVNTLLVKHLPESLCNEVDIDRLFQPYGPIKNIETKISNRPGSSSGRALIEFASVENAQQAMREMNSQKFDGKSIFLVPTSKNYNLDAEPREVSEDITTIRIFKLPQNASEVLLFHTFSKFGTVMHCKVYNDLDTELPNYGFVTFSSSVEAERAISEINQVDQNERVFDVRMAKHNYNPFLHFDEQGTLARRSLQEPILPRIISGVEAMHYPAPLTEELQRSLLIRRMKTVIIQTLGIESSTATQVTEILKEMGKGRISRLVLSHEDLKEQVSVALHIIRVLQK